MVGIWSAEISSITLHMSASIHEQRPQGCYSQSTFCDIPPDPRSEEIHHQEYFSEKEELHHSGSQPELDNIQQIIQGGGFIFQRDEF